MTIANTMFDKVWAEHKVASLGSGYDLIHIDRCFLHDLCGPPSLQNIENRGLSVFSPELVFATPDHLVTSVPGKWGGMDDKRENFISSLREKCQSQGITLFDVGDNRQGIVHVIYPELGITLPGATVVCGDSHTSTHGGIGAIAWGVGVSELTHVLASQCIIEKKPKKMQLRFVGTLPDFVTAKDMILYVIGQYGSDFGSGYAVEYCGDTIKDLSIEERLTICNMSVEFGAKIGFIAPDEKTFSYLNGLEFSPAGSEFELAKRYWLSLHTDKSAIFDKSLVINVSNLQPQISWGINPAQTIAIGEKIPNLEQSLDRGTKESWKKALDYMGLKAGERIEGTKIDQVFIGSCTNSRISDLQAAAALIKGRQVADSVEAWVVPGSQLVKIEAEALGLDKLFKEAGFQWRQPSCSLCPAANGDYVAPGKRCVTTSNRNFIGRQGPQARTHLASPQTAVAAAICGYIIDPRKLDNAG